MDTETELRPGLMVKVTNDHGGSFVGTVGQVTEHMAIIVPQAPQLRRWWPDGYDIGRAHWDGKVEILEA